jgi:hypothetical protein
LKFRGNVSFWCKNVFWFDENTSSEDFSINPDLNSAIVNTDFDIQMWKWFELFTPKQVNKLKFLEIFANHFTEKITFDSWFHKVEDSTYKKNLLNPDFDSQMEMCRRVCKKLIHFLIPLATKYGVGTKFWALKPEKISLSIAEVPALIRIMMNLVPRSQSRFTCRIFIHQLAPDEWELLNTSFFGMIGTAEEENAMSKTLMSCSNFFRKGKSLSNSIEVCLFQNHEGLLRRMYL